MAATGKVRYRKVAQTEDEVNDGEAKKKRRAELIEKINTKIQAVFWVGASAAIIYYTDMPRKLMEDNRVNKSFLNVAVVCLAVNVCIFLYLNCWVTYQERVLSRKKNKPIKLEWEVYCPRMIPTMTAFGVLFFVTIIKAMWPLYGFLTPLIVFALFVGFIFSTHFFPC